MAAQGRILALDWGHKRIGLALSDPGRMLASPLHTLDARPVDGLLRKLRDLITEYDIVQLVVGLPLNMDGTQSDGVLKARELAERLKDLELPIDWQDERLSSFSAEKKLREAGRKPSRNKAMVDRAAAAVFLQEYLDSRQTGATSSETEREK
ncbi:Holliday junction resolvase RuvX [bacterium]|nr:Holliday junction resolvase RuvX [bacterium]